MFDINGFNSQINKMGLAKSNLFYATLLLPEKLNLEFPAITNNAAYLCKTVELPSMDLQVMEVQNQNFGPTTKRPIALQPGTVTCIFMMDADFYIKSMFHRWIQMQYNYNGKTTAGIGNMLPYEVGYKDDYAGALHVDVYSNNLETHKYKYEFEKANPINIGAMSLAWENQAEIMTMSVTFTYEKFSVSGMKTGDRTYGSRNGGLITRSTQHVQQVDLPQTVIQSRG